MGASEKKKLSDKVTWLAQYPNNEVKQFKRYVINGVKFHTNFPLLILGFPIGNCQNLSLTCIIKLIQKAPLQKGI